MFGDGVNTFRVRVRPKITAQQDWAWQPGGPWWSPSQQGFHAANARRRLSQWLPNKGTINTLVTQGGEILRDRARDMVRNNPHAASAADSYVGNLIGTGIRPSSLIPDPELRSAVNKLWAQWACECDVDGQVDFYGMQELVARCLFEAGECFIRYRPRSIEDGLTVPLQLLVLESDMLDYSYNLLAPNGNLIMNGVEFDASHRRVAYHFWPYHPGQIIITPLRDFRFRVRIPAEEILHVFKPRRPGDVRGVPLVSSALVKLFLLDQYDDAELDRKKVAAMFAGFVKTPQPEEMLIQNAEPAPYPNVDEGLVTLEPGTIQTLLPGEDITFSQPAAVGGDYEPFQYRQILPAFQAMGVPYALGAGDLRHANYSSLRGAIVEYRRRLGQMQANVIVYQMCKPIYERWLRDAILSEAIDIPDFADDPRLYLSVKWMPPKFEWVDPLKDQQGEKLAVDSGFKSRSDVIEEMGDDPLDTDLRIKQDHVREQALGLDFPPAGKGAGKPGAPGQPGQPGEGEEGGKQFDGQDIKDALEDQGIELPDEIAEQLTALMRDHRIRAFEESKHPRVPKGTTEGGQFTKGETGEAGSKKKSSEPAPGVGGDGGQHQTVPFGLGLPEGSPLRKALGTDTISYGDAEKVAEQIARSTGAQMLQTHHVVGGWTDPSTGEYSSEPTLVGEFHGEPHDATFAAEAIAHVLGPQKEVWVVRDAEGLPAARDLRIDIMPTKPGVTAQQLAEVARKVDPELLAGFTQTVDGEGRTGITLLIPEGIAPRKRAQTTSVMVKPLHSIQPIEVLVNPSLRDVIGIAKDTDYGEVRVIRDDDGNLYAWKAEDAIHQPVARALGVAYKEADADIWMLDRGKLVSTYFNDARPYQWLEETHAVPKGPATIADKADAAVMKLAGALADAGIDADVLPTAAIVDKRIGDAQDWRGYGSSIEREAGADALAALDDYRTQLGESLAKGRGVPAFHESLKELARRAAPQEIGPPVKLAAAWRQRFFAKDWDESEHPRGKTTEGTTPGSFAPGEGGQVDLAAGHVVFQSKSLGRPTQHADTTPEEAEKQARESIEEYAKAAREAGVTPLAGSQGHPRLISTRLPWGVKATENGEQVFLKPDIDAMRREPEKFKADMALFKNKDDYPGLRDDERKGTPEQIARTVINRIKSNLKFMYCNMPTDIRDRAVLWYVGARRMVDRKAKETGLNDAAIAGVYAALSPQKDWFVNVYLGDRVIDIYTKQQNHPWDAEMEKGAKVALSTDVNKKLLKKIRGKTLGELTDPMEKGAWIRAFDQSGIFRESKLDRSYRSVTPEGDYDGFVKTKGKGNPNAQAAWQTAKNIAGAVMAIESNGDREVISKAMGAAHKVRSFYNNFLDPYSADDDVTIDTHATAAGWMLPLGNTAASVLHSLHSSPQKENAPKNFRNASESAYTGNSGLYGIYATAYREAAHELGLPPRALQSAVWEAQRGLYGEDRKALERAQNVWADYREGTIDLAEAQRRIVSDGYKPPAWY